MFTDIRKLAKAQPFVPFTIHMADGKAFRVPTADHITVPPKGGRVVVLSGEGDYDVLSALLVTRLNVDSGEPAITADDE